MDADCAPTDRHPHAAIGVTSGFSSFQKFSGSVRFPPIAAARGIAVRGSYGHAGEAQAGGEAGVRRWAKRIGLGILGVIVLFVVALLMGVPLAWELLFGFAYCADGYGGCPWSAPGFKAT